MTILAASGATGLELTRQALERGHTVTAIARDPDRIDLPAGDRLNRVAGDVLDPTSMGRALQGSTTVLSGLGITGKDKPLVLRAGAHAVIAARPEHIIWIGAFGTGASAEAAGPVTRNMLKLFLRAELADKVGADTSVRKANGTVFHAGPLSNGPLSSTRRTVSLDAVPRRIFPARISRATLSAAMLDEAGQPRHPGVTLIPLER